MRLFGMHKERVICTVKSYNRILIIGTPGKEIVETNNILIFARDIIF
jgi:hypothetical protein